MSASSRTSHHRWKTKLSVATVILITLAACSEAPTDPTAPAAVPALSRQGSVISTTETVDVDARLVGVGSPNQYAYTAGTLDAGAKYKVTVVGNWSAWPPSWWTCTSPYPTLFLSPSVPDGTNAGFDAEWRYADAGNCNRVDTQYPGIEFSLEAGAANTFFDPTPIDGTFNVAHKYEYTVTGTGQRMAFFIPDTYGDNHGVMKVTVALVQAAPPPTVTLTATIRDFTPQTNPDFESAVGDDRGIVTGVLGADGKPVYAHPGFSTYTTHGQQYFDQWYRNVQGVNQSTTYDLVLTRQANGTYVYSNGAYFPIDGQLFGNYGNTGHNFSFTSEIHTTFTYSGGEVFSFTGDDDVWVFINGKLAIDLGGVHGAETASVALDNLNLTVGHDYSLDIFQAERHTSGSNFSITTSLQLVPVPTDATPPVIQPVVTGTLGNNGWYTSDVNVSWNVSDAESDITSAPCASSAISADTQSATETCSATSAGGTSSASVTVKRDATKPVVAFSGNALSYLVDQTVTITCSASDAMSGIASDNCADANTNTPAYLLALGSHTLSASATDKAGNSSTASTSFSVNVSAGSVCDLVKQWVSQAGVANSLCVKLNQQSARAFNNEVRAQTGKFVPADKAAILIALATALLG